MSEINLPAIVPAREALKHNRNSTRNVAISFILFRFVPFAKMTLTKIATKYSMTHCDTVRYWPLTAGY